MSPDEQTTLTEQLLRKINFTIAEKETEGDLCYFNDLLAPTFAMLRANGELADRGQFLAKVAPSDERRTSIESIQIFDDRAVVTCVVEMGMEMGQDNSHARQFHNVCVFIRSDVEDWKLFAWANRKLPHTQ